MDAEHNIPKIIHYCWFGGKPLPELTVKCIDSWKKCCPDYEFRQWDEHNFDCNSCRYTREAYRAGKWAFVSDYARFKILYEHGGVYLDTDVELLRPLEGILEQGGFMASESEDCQVATGLGIAAPKGLPLYAEIIRDYEESVFTKADGSSDLITVVKRVTGILERHGLEHKNIIQHVAGIVIYPKEYFCPLDFRTKKLCCTENTHAIHYYDGSWWTEEQKFAGKITVQLRKVFPERFAKRLAKAAAILRCRGVAGLKEEITKWMGKRNAHGK